MSSVKIHFDLNLFHASLRILDFTLMSTSLVKLYPHLKYISFFFFLSLSFAICVRLSSVATLTLVYFLISLINFWNELFNSMLLPEKYGHRQLHKFWFRTDDVRVNKTNFVISLCMLRNLLPPIRFKYTQHNFQFCLEINFFETRFTLILVLTTLAQFAKQKCYKPVSLVAQTVYWMSIKSSKRIRTKKVVGCFSNFHLQGKVWNVFMRINMYNFWGSNANFWEATKGII